MLNELCGFIISSRREKALVSLPLISFFVALNREMGLVLSPAMMLCPIKTRGPVRTERAEAQKWVFYHQGVKVLQLEELVTYGDKLLKDFLARLVCIFRKDHCGNPEGELVGSVDHSHHIGGSMLQRFFVP